MFVGQCSMSGREGVVPSWLTPNQMNRPSLLGQTVPNRFFCIQTSTLTRSHSRWIAFKLNPNKWMSTLNGSLAWNIYFLLRFGFHSNWPTQSLPQIQLHRENVFILCAFVCLHALQAEWEGLHSMLNHRERLFDWNMQWARVRVRVWTCTFHFLFSLVSMASTTAMTTQHAWGHGHANARTIIDQGCAILTGSSFHWSWSFIITTTMVSGWPMFALSIIQGVFPVLVPSSSWLFQLTLFDWATWSSWPSLLEHLSTLGLCVWVSFVSILFLHP